MFKLIFLNKVAKLRSKRAYCTPKSPAFTKTLINQSIDNVSSKYLLCGDKFTNALKQDLNKIIDDSSYDEHFPIVLIQFVHNQIAKEAKREEMFISICVSIIILIIIISIIIGIIYHS